MKTAAAYIRVSTEDQVEYSPDSQLKAVRKYAKEHDMILPEEFVFIDEGISGRTAGKRPEFQRMIGTAKIKPKPFDVILLWKFSRFARNRQDSIVYKSMLRKQCGIDVVSISEQLGEDNTSILIEALIEAMDEYYSLNLAEEVKRGMTEKFSRGGVVSQPPFGYRMGGDIFVPDEVNANIVRMIFEDFVNGSKTMAIAKKLNSMGVTTTKGNPWSNRNVEYVLTNPVYLGKLRRSRDPQNRHDRFNEDSILVEGKHEPIIDQSVFEQAQARRAEIKKAYPKHARQTPAEYMLRGIIRCDNCGSTLILTGTKNARYLQCHSYNRGACQVSHGIAVEKANRIVIEKLTADLGSDTLDIAVKPAASVSTGAVTATIKNMIAKEQRKLERIREAYEAGVDTLEEYRQNKAKITDRIEELQKELYNSPTMSEQERVAVVKGKINASLAILTNPDLSETVKNEALLSFVDKIMFVKPQNVIEIHYKV